jgi:hypothetical protein
MIELVCADSFIKTFEKLHDLKVHKIPLEYANGRRVLVLMCKCRGVWIALPHCSEAYVQTDLTNYKETPPFSFVQTQDGNLLCTKNINWEIRDRMAFSSNVYADKLNFLIKLESDLMSVYSSNVRRKIRKAQSLGVEIRTKGKHLIRDFYKVYSKRMFELGSPFCSKEYIKKGVKLQTHKIFVAYFENKPIGAATLIKRDEESFENALFATQRESNQLYTSYLLHYEMMRFSLQENAKYYYLGRSTRMTSVHQYKKHFKPEEIPLYWSTSRKTKNIRDNKMLKKLWRLLPFALSKAIGSFFYKRIY